MTVIIDLPFPPTSNHANVVARSKTTGKPVVYPSKDKKAFQRAATVMFYEQRRNIGKVEGPFSYHVTLNEKLRGPTSDGENRLKHTIDFLQSVGVIENDKLAQSGSWSWGPCEHGCRVFVKPFVAETTITGTGD